MNRIRPHLKDIPDCLNREKFLQGLQKEIREKLEEQEWNTYEDMTKQAIKLSVVIKPTPSLKNILEKQPKKKHEGQNPHPTSNKTGDIKFCNYCKAEDHLVRECPKGRKNLIAAARKKNKISFKAARALVNEGQIKQDGSIKE